MHYLLLLPPLLLIRTERGPSVTVTRILDVEVDVAMARVELVVAARVVLIARRERLSAISLLLGEGAAGGFWGRGDSVKVHGVGRGEEVVFGGMVGLGGGGNGFVGARKRLVSVWGVGVRVFWFWRSRQRLSQRMAREIIEARLVGWSWWRSMSLTSSLSPSRN